MVDAGGGAWSYLVGLRVHRMGTEIVGFHRLERAGAYVEVDRGDQNAALVDLREQLRGEMQAGGWRGDAAVVRRVHGLIAVRIGRFRRAADVRWQWHFAVLRECSARVECPDKSDATQSAAQDLNDLDGTVVAERDAALGFQLSARMPHGQPRTVGHCADH